MKQLNFLYVKSAELFWLKYNLVFILFYNYVHFGSLKLINAF